MRPLATIAISCLVALIALPSQAREDVEVNDFDDFGAFLDEFRRDSGTPSLSAVIVKDGEIAWEGYFGTYDDEGDLPTIAETTYKIASVTKPIAATALMAESVAGRLDLATPMTQDAGWTELCQFFTTSTTIPFMVGGDDRLGNVISPMDCERATTLGEMLDMRANGDDFVYNPIAYARIDRVLDGAGYRDLRSIVRDNVIEPAQMTDVALGWRDPEGGAALRYLAEPFHVIDGRVVKQPLPDDDFRAAAGIIASPRNIAAFDIAFDDGRFRASDSDDAGSAPELVLAPFVTREIGPLGDYYRGWFLEDWNGTRLMWHSGWNERQYSALYLKVPEQRLTLIVMANTESVWWSNSLVKAEIIESPIARRFLETFGQ